MTGNHAPATGIKTFGRARSVHRHDFAGTAAREPWGGRSEFADERQRPTHWSAVKAEAGCDWPPITGRRLPQFTTGNGCDGLYGDILPILAKLDPAITTVVSGHTHWAYVCNGTAETGAGRLMTSAGKNGYFATDLRLRFDPATHALIGQSAENVVVAMATEAATRPRGGLGYAEASRDCNKVIGRRRRKAATIQ